MSPSSFSRNIIAEQPRRIEWLDALRGVAVSMVVLVHAAQVTPVGSFPHAIFQFGQYGVQLFFVISMLTSLLTLKSGTQHSDWFIKRVVRISVVYYFGLLFYFPIFWIEAQLGIIGHAFRDPINILANILFIHGWVPSANNSVVPGGWSIAVEMNFYLLAPFCIALLTRPHKAMWIFGGSAFLLLMLNFLFNGPVKNNTFFYFWPVNQIPVFLSALALVAANQSLGRDFWHDTVIRPGVVGFGFLLTVVGMAFGVGFNIDHIFTPTLIGIGFTLIILGWGRAGRHIISRRSLIYLGRISFSLYIIHFAFEHFVRFVVKQLPSGWGGQWMIWIISMTAVFVSSVIAAHFLHRFVEMRYLPIAKWISNWVHRHSRK